jgi:hypothetical protein
MTIFPPAMGCLRVKARTLARVEEAPDYLGPSRPVAPIPRTFIVFSVCGPVPLLNLIRITTALNRISTLRGPFRQSGMKERVAAKRLSLHAHVA